MYINLANPFAPLPLQELLHYYELVRPYTKHRYFASSLRYCTFHFASWHRFPSSVNKPKYWSCLLNDACRPANKQVTVGLIMFVILQTLLTEGCTFSTLHQRFICIHLQYSYLTSSWHSLFHNAQYLDSLSKHLMVV